MTNSDIFGGNTPPVEDDKLPEGTSYLDTLVGEGKVYKDPELLAKGAWHKDKHISKIEQENQTLRAELEKRANSEQFVNQIMERLGSKNESSNQESQVLSEQRQSDQPDVAQIAREVFNKEQQRLQEARNKELVRSELEKIWGTSNYTRQLEAATKAAGLSKEEANALAGTKPELFLGAVKHYTPKSNVDNSHVPPSGQHVLGSPTNGAKKYADYERLRKTDPKAWNTDAVQIQMMADAIKLGEEFYR